MCCLAVLVGNTSTKVRLPAMIQSCDTKHFIYSAYAFYEVGSQADVVPVTLIKNSETVNASFCLFYLCIGCYIHVYVRFPKYNVCRFLVATKVEARFHVRSASWIPEEVRERLLKTVIYCTLFSF